MSIEEWDRTLLGMTKQEYAAEKRKQKFNAMRELAVEIVRGFVFVAVMVGFVWLCATVSGYHWE